MLTAMIFALNAESQARVQRRCISAGTFNLYQSPEYRPTVADMVRLINAYSPELLFVEFDDRADAIQMHETLRETFPKLAILGFAEDWKSESLLKARLGLLRILPSRAPLEEFQHAVLEAVDGVNGDGPDNLIVVLPSKAGSGASTLALGVAGALAKNGKSAVLVEADLHSGPVGMYLKIEPQHSVVDALQESRQLDANWNKLVTPVHNFAVLPASNIRGPIPQPSPWEYKRLISFIKPRYEHVIFDLPEVVNPATETIVLDARAVYVVCTPEVPSLVLARKRSASLIGRGVPPDRLKIILNRHTKDGPEPAAIEEILGRKIEELVPNDYKAVWSANLERRLVAESSALGREMDAFARKLAGLKAPVAVAPTKPQRKIFGLFPAA